MSEIFCPSCRLEQPTSHTYCARCGTRLPVELVQQPTKTARFFAGVKVADTDSEHAFLRVSHYRVTETLRAAEGEIDVPVEHVRFSVWANDRAHCVISLPASEARSLASFLDAELGGAQPPQERKALDNLA